jgi:protein gp37
MSINSTIEWTDITWNPVRGCTLISPGCEHCYARVLAERFRGVRGHAYEHGFDLRLVPEMLTEPFNWTKASRVFVNSMSDLFHKDVPDDFIVDVAAVMVHANWHTYQILTKRSERLRNLLNSKLSFAASQPHIWWGVSVEDKKFGVHRIEHLRAANATNRFLSVEPLLENLGALDLRGIHWVIVGGESGPGARKMEATWVENVHRQCLEAHIPFFFKQWGGVKKKQAGRTLNGQTYDNFPASIPMPEISLAKRKAGLISMYGSLKHFDDADKFLLLTERERHIALLNDPLYCDPRIA